MVGLTGRSAGAVALSMLLIAKTCVCATPGASPGLNAGACRRGQACRSGDLSLLAYSHKVNKVPELGAQDFDEAPAPPQSDGSMHTNLAAMQAFVQTQVEHATRTWQHAGNATNMSDSVLSALDVIKLHIKTLNTSVLIQHQEDQGEITDSLALIGQCVNEGDDGDIGVLDSKSAMEEHRSGHSACREQEVEKAQVKALKCQEYNTGRLTDFSQPPTCPLDKVATANPEELEAFEECLRKFAVWFKLWDLYKACDAATQEHSNQTDLCNAKQSTFEQSSCMYASKRGGFCDCRSRSTEFYETRSAAVKRAEAARKADYQAARRIDCLFGVWTAVTMEGKNESISRCTEMDIDTDHLSIDYGSVPSSELDCSATLAKPCDDAWLQSEYESAAWHTAAPAASCSPCPAPATSAAPTPEHFTCKTLHDQGQTVDGAYDISIVDSDGQTMQVKTYCDMANGGWTLVGQMHGHHDVDRAWLRTLHNEAALQTRDIEDGWACLPAVDMAVNMATSVRLSSSDVSKYVWWDMDEDRSRGTWWNHAAGYVTIKGAADHAVTVQDQDGHTKQCYQNPYGILKYAGHGGSYPAASANDGAGYTHRSDLCMAVGVQTVWKDGWGQNWNGMDAPRSDDDWPNDRLGEPAHVSVWLK